MKMSIKKAKHANFSVAAVCLILGGCFGGGGGERYHNSEFTYGNMKWHLEKGKTRKSEVLETFGPPNITSTDSEGLDMWVYQKMSTSKIESAFGGGLNLSGMLKGMGAVEDKLMSASVGGNGGFQGGKHTSTQSSKTCTMILKFDDAGFLVEYRFRTSNF